MEQSGSIEIDKPIEEVFKLTNGHVTEWSKVVVEDEIIEEKNGGGVGTTFKSVTEERGRRMTFLGTITQWEPPTLNAISLVGDTFDLQVEYRFEDLGGRTRVTQDSTVNGKGFMKVCFALFGGLMKKQSCDALDVELQSLKRFCEGQ